MIRLMDTQRGTIVDLFNMFSGGALERMSVFALNVVPVHLGLDHHPVDGAGDAEPAGAAQGRRVGAAQADPVHAHRHRVAGLVPGGRRRDGAAEFRRWRRRAGRGQPRPGLRVQRHRRPDRRDHVPDVAGRADHRARRRQRHLAADLRRHRRRPARRGRIDPGTGAQRRPQPAQGHGGHRDRAGGDGVRGVHGARPAPDHGQLRAPPGRAACLPEPVLAPAAQDQHGGRDSGDFRFVDHHVPGHRAVVDEHGGRGALAAGAGQPPGSRARRCTTCCTRA